MDKIDVQLLGTRRHLVEKCARWNHSEWGRAMGRSLADTVAGFQAILESDDETALVAFVNGTPAGMVLMIACDLESHAHLKPWLAGLYVHPDFRGKRIARALVAEVELMAGQRGDPALFLYTAIPDFYGALGWSTHETLDRDDAKLEVMTKALDPQ
jgi:predicted N-acetyltransferase YhbS